MALTREFMDAVQNGETRTIRILIARGMVNDPSLRDYAAQMDYLKTSGQMSGELFQPFDGGYLNEETSAWNKAYVNELTDVVINENFSQERLDHLRKVVESVFRDRAAARTQREQTARSKGKQTRKGTGCVVLTGGALVFIVGLALSQAVIAVVGGAAAAFGCYMIVTDKDSGERS